MTEQTATEQLLALELAREARRRRRNRVLVWLAVVAAVAAAVYLGIVRPAQERQDAQDRREQGYFCAMMWEYGSDSYLRCLED